MRGVALPEGKRNRKQEKKKKEYARQVPSIPIYVYIYIDR
jgi:hypothetical protein